MIVRRYLQRDVAGAFAGVLAVLVLVWVSHRFVRYLGLAAAGQLAGEMLFQLVGLKLAANLSLLLPPALFFAVLLAVGRLYRDSEVTALAAAGVGPGTLARAVLGLSLPYALAAAALTLFLAPPAARVADEVEGRAEERADFSNLLAGRFRDLSGGDRVLFAEGARDGGKTLVGVFAQVRTAHDLYILAAETAFQRRDGETGDRFLVLVDGHRYQGEPGSLDYVVTSYREHAVRIEDSRGPPASQRVQGIPTSALFGAGSPGRQAELQWRIALPVSCVVLGVLGLLLARTSPRQGRYGGLFNGVLVYFLYTNLLGAGRGLIEQGRVPAAFGLWPAHLVALGLALVVAAAQSSRGARLLAALRARVRAGGRP